MRSGFKGIGNAVLGEEGAAGEGKSKWLGTAVTILLLAAVAGLVISKL